MMKGGRQQKDAGGGGGGALADKGEVSMVQVLTYFYSLIRGMRGWYGGLPPW